MQKSVQSFSGVLILGAILLLLNNLSDALFQRFYFDLTEDRLFTLSQGSKNIVSNLKYPITIRAYLSKTEGTKYPAIKLYGDRVVSLLREFERVGNGKITLEIYDPRPDTDEESWADKYGITPLSMPGGEKVYFGLAAVNSLGAEEVIPVFSLARQEYLEYDITKSLYALSVEKKPVIGIISSLKLNGGDSPAMYGRPQASQPWIFMSQIQQLAEVRMLQPDLAAIDPDVKLLMLIHPKKLTASALYAVDQFVMHGGNLFVAIDPYCSADMPDPAAGQDPTSAMMQDKSSNLKELLTKWGVEMVERKAVGDINLATKVATSRDAEPEDFVLWVSLDAKSERGANTINRTDILTGQLNTMLFPWPGALKKVEVPGVSFQPLFQTTPEAELVEETDYRFGGGTPSALLSKYTPGSEPQILGARLDGRLPSNYSERPKDLPQPEKPVEHLSQSVGDAHVIVVADADFLSDQAAAVSQNFLGTRMVSLVNDNLAFAANVGENLLGSSDLISLRSRGQYTRPFTRVRDIERRAEEKYRREEQVLQAELNSANQRLSQLQAGTDKAGGEQVLSKALLDEVKKFRDQRAEAQQRLREVRKNLRQDKERLGQWLFLVNTFLVPALLIIGSALFYRRGRKKTATV
ncbi:MAG: Gldg family protein [Bdellovibrionota bacterium]